jgi:hypothetical protein
LKSIDSVKKILDSKDIAYLEFFRLPSNTAWGPQGGIERVEFSYYENPLLILRDILLKKMFGSSKYDKRKLLRLPRINRRMPYGLEPYGGSMWFCLPKKHVDYTLKYLENKPDLLNFFKHSLIPDELLFQTILMNSPLKDTILNDNLRYIDWSKKGVSLPAILTVDDADNLLKSPKFFARKFDIESDKLVLDLIDSQRIATSCID